MTFQKPCAMNILYKIISTSLLATAFLLGLVACSDDEQELRLTRQFKPATISTTNGPTSATVSWAASLFTEPGEVTYEVQVARTNAFEAIEFETTSTQTQVVITDNFLGVRVDYFARVRAVGKGSTGNSDWLVSNAFRITGEQLFLGILDNEIRDNQVTLRWQVSPTLTRISLTPGGGEPTDYPLTAGEIEEGVKVIEGLTATTFYTAELFQGTVSKGLVTFTTKEPSIYTRVLTPADDFFQAITAAQSGDLIGLEPGVYNVVDDMGLYVVLNIISKTITIESVSGNPNDTKVNFREITLKGTGAGITLRGIEFDGAASTTNGQQALYFLNMAGLDTDGQDANFTSIIVENCIVKNMGNCFLRGNRGANNGHKIDLIKVNNTLVENSAQILTNWTFFQINKLEFQTIELTNSTFHKVGRQFIDWSTTITVVPIPVVNIDHITLNGIGMAGRRVLFDANAANVNLTISNSIFANSPYPSETAATDAIRGTGASSSLVFQNNNYFNLTTGGAEPTPLTFPAAVQMLNNKTINLGWTHDTSNFTLPGDSELRTSSTTGGPVGDPRWTF
jgi:hypothetical protein